MVAWYDETDWARARGLVNTLAHNLASGHYLL